MTYCRPFCWEKACACLHTEPVHVTKLCPVQKQLASPTCLPNTTARHGLHKLPNLTPACPSHLHSCRPRRRHRAVQPLQPGAPLPGYKEPPGTEYMSRVEETPAAASSPAISNLTQRQLASRDWDTPSCGSGEIYRASSTKACAPDPPHAPQAFERRPRSTGTDRPHSLDTTILDKWHNRAQACRLCMADTAQAQHAIQL